MTHQEFSTKGGKAGTGDKKRRSPDHYKRLRAFAASKGSGSIARDAVRGEA